LSPEIVSGWKDIANYLGRGVRTVQRYERDLGLPIRRPAGKPKGSVIATRAELDGWVKARPLRESSRLPRAIIDQRALLNEFRRNIAELHRLRQESAEWRQKLHKSWELLQTTGVPRVPERERDGIQALSPNTREPADVLAFDRDEEKSKASAM
jgi:hypothetical protein